MYISMNVGSNDDQVSDKIENPSRTRLIRSCSYYGATPFTRDLLKISWLPTLADLKVLDFVSQTGLPCHWEQKLLAIVPNSDQKTYTYLHAMWKFFRDPIRDYLGQLGSESSGKSTFWKNSATTLEEFLNDSKGGSEIFLKLCEDIARISKGTCHFGPENCNIVKSKESVLNKIQRLQKDNEYSISQAIQIIEDGIRGTLSFKTPCELRNGILKFIRFAEKRDWETSVSNLWSKDYAGYLDIDIQIKIPLKNGRNIRAELQFHLDSFYDGTKDSITSRAHKIYSLLRTYNLKNSNIDFHLTELTEISRLYFTTALFHTYWNAKR